MLKLFSYNTEILPKVRIIGHIRYQTPWTHFARCIDEYVLYVIREGNMYLKENNIKYHLKAGDFFLLEPDLFHEGYCPATCDYYYVHFKSKELNISKQSENESLKELIEKRRTSIMSYNLDEADVIDPNTYIPKLFRLSDLEYRQRLIS
ncbi:MAG: hypothetical protein HGA25_00070 [Clostridiales bacterium]|nr:hypothetical protein [Clostridiales bacterium]